jgi:hypothetical protein
MARKKKKKEHENHSFQRQASHSASFGPQSFRLKYILSYRSPFVANLSLFDS